MLAHRRHLDVCLTAVIILSLIERHGGRREFSRAQIRRAKPVCCEAIALSLLVASKSCTIGRAGESSTSESA